MVDVNAGLATTVGTGALVLTFVLKNWVLTKMDPKAVACIGGALTTIAAAFTGHVVAGTSLQTQLSSAVVGTAVAGLSYDKVLDPILSPMWAWVKSRFPKGK